MKYSRYEKFTNAAELVFLGALTLALLACMVGMIAAVGGAFSL